MKSKKSTKLMTPIVPVDHPVILSKAGDIRSAIRSILEDSTSRRTVMVAFVGAGAEDYLPAPSGLELICWDKEGCTDPNTIRELRNRNVNVYFAKNLHMKVYWSEQKGAVIGSSNLSGNGLGDGGLFEAVALLPPGLIDIDRLKAGLEINAVTGKSLQALDKRTRAYRAKNMGKMVFVTGKSKIAKQKFDQWYLSPDRTPWKLFVYADYVDKIPEEASSKLTSLGYSEPVDFWTGAATHTKKYEWLLSIDTNKNGQGIYWSCADFSVPMRKDDPEYEEGFPMFAVQCSKTTVYGETPFDVGEAKFKRALRKFLSDNGVSTHHDGRDFAPSGILDRGQLGELFEYYQSAT